MRAVSRHFAVISAKMLASERARSNSSFMVLNIIIADLTHLSDFQSPIWILVCQVLMETFFVEYLAEFRATVHHVIYKNVQDCVGFVIGDRHEECHLINNSTCAGGTSVNMLHIVCSELLVELGGWRCGGE